MMPPEQLKLTTVKELELWTVEELKQHLREEQSRVNKCNDRVRLAKHLLAAADEPDLEYLVVDEEPVPEAYEEPPADALTIVGPGNKVAVCQWTRTSANEDPGHVCFPYVFVTHRSGDELCGYMAGRYFDEKERITFELKHICYVEDEGAGSCC